MNFRKLRLGLLTFGFCVCLILIVAVEAQINFSPGWGKRVQALPYNRRNIPIDEKYPTYFNRMFKGNKPNDIESRYMKWN